MAARAGTYAASAAPRSAVGPCNAALRGLFAPPTALSRGARGIRPRARPRAGQFRPDREEGDGLSGTGGPGPGTHGGHNGPEGRRSGGTRGSRGEFLRPDVGAGRGAASVVAPAPAQRV